MRNRTYGGVRGRKTKVGRKLLRFPPTRFQSIWKYISNGINFYNWGLQGKPFFLLYIHL